MNSWDPTFQEAPRPMSLRPMWFEALLPVSAAPLVVLLLLIMPVFLLAAESLFAPVYEYIHSLLMPVNAGMSYTSLPLLLLFKIVLFSAFTFTGVTLLLLKISCLYHEVWSHFLRQPHPDHTPYHPDQQSSMVALFNWNLFRWFRIMGPPVGWLTLTALGGAFFMWFFNAFTDFGFFTFQLQFTLGFFMMMVLGFFTMLSLIRALWAVFGTILGDVAAMTEPEKPTQVLYDRSRKLAFNSPWSLLLYPLYFLFYLAMAVEVILFVSTYDIRDLMSFPPDLLMILGFECATLVVLIMLSAMKFLTYHDALARFYQHQVTSQARAQHSGFPRHMG